MAIKPISFSASSSSQLLHSVRECEDKQRPANTRMNLSQLLIYFLVGSSIHTRSKKKHKQIYVNMRYSCHTLPFKTAPLPQKIPPSTQPDSWAPQRQASQHHAALPRGQGHSDRTCGRSETFTLAREPFPPIVGDGFTLLPTPNIFFNHNRVWIWFF